VSVKQNLYPRIKPEYWWNLRNTGKELPDVSFTPKSISNVLKVSASFAFMHIFSVLTSLELIERNGNLTAQGHKWLMDRKYEEVCEDIIGKVYPAELVDTIPNPLENRDAVVKWFAAQTSAEPADVELMTDTYLMFCKADPTDFVEPEKEEKPPEKPVQFPRISPVNWWTIRDHAKDVHYFIFTPKSIATVLKLQVSSVYNTILPTLKQFKLIDDDGNLTKLGKLWINDDYYSEVCQELIKDVYPIELIEGIPNPVYDRDKVRNWFQKMTNNQQSFVYQMAATYILLSKADVTDSQVKKKGIKLIARELPPLIEVPKEEPVIEEIAEIAVEPEIKEITPEIIPVERKRAVKIPRKPKKAIEQVSNIPNIYKNNGRFEFYIKRAVSRPKAEVNIQISISADFKSDKFDYVQEMMNKYLSFS